MSKEITINLGEEIDIYAICLYGWGRGKTVSEALRNMRDCSRGMVSKDFTCEKIGKNGKKEMMPFDELIDEQRVRLFATNKTDGIEIEFYTPKPSKGKWVLFLGDAFNNAKFYEG